MKKGRFDERREPTFAPSVRPSSDFDDDRVGASRGSRKKAVRRRSIFGRLLYWCVTLSIWCLVGGAILIAYYAAQLPPIDQLAVPKRPPNIAILAEDSSLLANRGDTGGAAVRLAELPPYLPKAFIAIEDRRFYAHYGVDPLGIFRALLRNVTGRGTMQGGSTLTQQLAKNLFLTQERTLPRKIQEAILALWLEHKYAKDQILELYLNRVYFGSGAFGVEAASQRYFGHSARNVTLPEAAMLAGLMKAPTKLAPNRNPDAAVERAAQVVTAMAQENYITEAMAKLALARPAQAIHEQGAGSVNYAADYVMDVLDDTVGAIDQDIVVTTTLNPALQASAEKALTDELDKKAIKYGVSQGALVSLDPEGAIKALVGGRNYAESQFNRAVAAKRQPGSAFKPFVYLAALEHGLTPDTIRPDAPINVKGWQPENYSHEYFGPVTLTKALSLSLNTVAVRLGLEVGAGAVVKVAHRLGITSDLQPNASIALGTSEVTPLELVGAYAVLANGGLAVQTHVITKVQVASSKAVLYLRKPASNGRVVEPQYAAMMNTMMQETLLTGTARKAELPGWQAAGKTGTSQDWRDAWFIGYTSHLVTGVWLGNDDNSPTKKASGGNLPVEIWSRFMTAAHQGVPPAPLPGGIWHDQGTPLQPPELMSARNGGLPWRDPATGQAAAPVPGRAAEAPSSQPLSINAIGARRDNEAGLTPPGLIPNGNAPPPARTQEPSFFKGLFGG